MTSNRPAGRPSSGNSAPPTSRRSARQQRLANREANRNLSRASTRGANGSGPSSLLMWSAVFIVLAVVLVGAAVLLSSSKGGSAIGSPNPPGVVTPSGIAFSGRTLGNANAPVTIDVYGDFRCSACFTFTVEGTEKSIVDNYISTGKAKLVWHDFITIDKGVETASRDAANAAWCAADQNKFWTMHDWLYANQDPGEAASAFSPGRLSEIAKLAGMDMTKWQPCYDSGTHNSDISAEQTSAPKTVTGTPTVIIANKLVGGQGLIPTYAEIKDAIEVALGNPSPSASASAAAAASVSAAAVTPSPTVAPSASVK
jgi:protein-disulfide isomerase